MAFDAAGKRIVTAAATAPPASGMFPELAAPVLRAGSVSAAAFEPGGTRLVTGNVGGPVQVWDTTTWQPTAAPRGSTGRFVKAADGAVQLSEHRR